MRIIHEARNEEEHGENGDDPAGLVGVAAVEAGHQTEMSLQVGTVINAPHKKKNLSKTRLTKRSAISMFMWMILDVSNILSMRKRARQMLRKMMMRVEAERVITLETTWNEDLMR